MREHQNKAVAYCPHCGNRAPQKLKGAHHKTEPEDERATYHLVACGTCGHALLYMFEPTKYEGPKSLMPNFRLDGKELVWPEANGLHRSVPGSVRTCYEEAKAIKHVAPNAFANQIRRSLEALCKDRGANQRSLFKSLKELADKGEIPPVLSEMTDVIRLLGNIGSHAADEHVGARHVDVLDDFFMAVVEYVYVAPFRIDEIKAELKRL